MVEYPMAATKQCSQMSVSFLAQFIPASRQSSKLEQIISSCEASRSTIIQLVVLEQSAFTYNQWCRRSFGNINPNERNVY